MKSLFNTIFSNKSLVLIGFFFLAIAGTLQNVFFIFAPIAYFLCLSAAYIISNRINDHAVNAIYNWSVKWSLFVVFLYLTGNHLKDVFVYAMFAYILINTSLSPMVFITKNKAAA